MATMSSRRSRSVCSVLIPSIIVALIAAGGRHAFASPRKTVTEGVAAEDCFNIGVMSFVCPRYEVLTYDIPTKQSPFLISASVFTMQTFIALATMVVISCTKSTVLLHGERFRQSVKAYCAISFFAAVMYVRLSRNVEIWVVEFGGTWLLERNVHWMFTTPVQWYVFCKSCYRARKSDLQILCSTAAATQFFGILMICSRSPLARIPFFTLAVASFCTMFAHAWRVHLLPDIAGVARVIRILYLVIWTLYPVVACARYANLISFWAEQVLLYSVLDICAKSLTFGGIVVARFAMTLDSMQKSVQFVFASNDFVLTVDSFFLVLDSFRALPLVAYHFGDALAECSLTELCETDLQRERLRDAAFAADRQPLDAPSPRCKVTFRLPHNQTMLHVELLLSKHLNGQRIIGVIVQGMQPFLRTDSGRTVQWQHTQKETQESIQAHPFTGAQGAEAQGEDKTDTPLASEPRDTENELSSAMQLIVALQNCMSVLSLTTNIRELLCSVFVAQSVPCGLFFWGGQGRAFAGDSDPVMVAMSPLLHSTLDRPAMPLRLIDFVGENAQKQIQIAISMVELVLFQMQCQLPNGQPCTITVLPLRRLAGSRACTQVHLCLILVDMDHSAREASSMISADKFYWYAPQSLSAVCIRTSTPSAYIGPPVFHQLPRPVRGSSAWILFYELLARHSDEDASDLHAGMPDQGRLAFAIPMKTNNQEAGGYTSNSGDFENALISAMNAGAMDSARPVPFILRPLLIASCSASM